MIFHFFALSWIVLLLAGCASRPQILVGYIDSNGSPVQDKRELFEQVDKIFSYQCPRIITIARSDKPHSQFHTHNSTVALGTDAQNSSLKMVLRHETTHLCMARITNKASTKERYRFYDEGFANIVGGEFSEIYKKRALATALEQAHRGRISFELLQKWSSYFGTPPNADFAAYDVGASFIYFIQDTYGPTQLFEFFRATSTADTLEAALMNVFKEPLAVVEKRWLEYIHVGSPLKTPPTTN